MIDFCVCSMSVKKQEKRHVLLTNKLDNVSFGPDPFIAGQGTVVSVQDFHLFFIGPSNSYYYHRDWHKCVGRVDQKSFGVTHVFGDVIFDDKSNFTCGATALALKTNQYKKKIQARHPKLDWSLGNGSCKLSDFA